MAWMWGDVGLDLGNGTEASYGRKLDAVEQKISLHGLNCGVEVEGGWKRHVVIRSRTRCSPMR
ncbi:hypothetical protein IG631_14722 [Alternaria alternata]|nr:hypothetical protein IG631_14722 [Alternaria alternata]